MPRRFFKKLLPSPEKLASIKPLRVVTKELHEPAIWHLSRRTVARAFAIGIFIAMLPMPMQMAAAAIVAIHLRASMPLAVSLVWITNPITMPPIFYLNYKIGSWLVGHDVQPIPDTGLSIAWVSELVAQSWLPLYFGSLLLGALFAVLGYFVISTLWHIKVKQKWRQRRHKRSSKSMNK